MRPAAPFTATEMVSDIRRMIAGGKRAQGVVKFPAHIRIMLDRAA
jgi:hypothetical protein